MIFSRAYYGTLRVRRVYYNCRLLWNYGEDVRGLLAIHLISLASGRLEPPDPVLVNICPHMQTSVAAYGMLIRRHIGLLPIQAEAVGQSRCAAVVRPSGATDGLLQAFAPGHSYGLVFCRGSAECLLGPVGMGRWAGCRYTAGATGAATAGSAPPKPQEVQVFRSSIQHEMNGSVRFVPQEVDKFRIHSTDGLCSFAGPGQQWALWQDPVLNGAVLHIRMVNHVTQNGKILTIT